MKCPGSTMYYNRYNIVQCVVQWSTMSMVLGVHSLHVSSCDELATHSFSVFCKNIEDARVTELW